VYQEPLGEWTTPPLDYQEAQGEDPETMDVDQRLGSCIKVKLLVE
jgi:hypothetical protein